jgi:hypothetical protein
LAARISRKTTSWKHVNYRLTTPAFSA